MSLLTRVIRLFKADLHGVIDQIENQELLLRQHLRDMQASLMQKETRLKQICRARDQARQDYENGQKECGRLEADLEIALQNGKDNIGRMLIRKLKPLSGIQEDRRRHIERLTQEIKPFRENIEQQRLQYEQLQQKATQFYHAAEQQRWEDPGPTAQSGHTVYDLSEDEIELELLQRKAAIKGGAPS